VETVNVQITTAGPPVDGLGEADQVEVTVGAPAHGGHCVARHEGHVIFVRHALPGERVIAQITEVHRGYLRADAVTVLAASPDRVPAGCPYAHPGGCGGCDLQHVAPAAQRSWKATVLAEQLTRLGRLSADEVDALGLRVELLPDVVGAGEHGWRTRVRYRVDATGRAGLLKHRSHEVVPIDRCAIAHPVIQELDLLATPWPTVDVLDVVASSGGDLAVLADEAVPVHGPGQVREEALDRVWRLPATAFWQVHPAAPIVLTSAVLDLLRPRPGEHAWDLYGGAGLFAAALAERVGVTGAVTLVEVAGDGTRAARDNLADLPIRVIERTVEQALRSGLPTPDVVVLDPPRTGAGAQVVRGIVKAAPRAVAYVACDPAALGRDVRTFRELGYRLAAVRAFDCFPMTHHLEAVALFLPSEKSPSPAAG
jgi:tRNA/tmRNA/rRNA uracil-C5-methylase (TrmA/RlmC/RlmD family)